MTTQVIFKIDKKMKDAAQAKAKKEGISLADLFKSVTQSYLNGTIGIGLVFKEPSTKILNIHRRS
ncbi:MAG: hypothetical protein A2431_02850 [Candidatus Zambryskibacteria bacterium RIFOXYC1_FULL_39_10]|uniref:Uncharacterized protein n=1 Tax=Candidatus Zambryskibacteria bacterium RIFOXYC1_FULL_39_10 TaxID=1802779 RepID=A0A1G2V014_9BACT|nr:MAG: hypothetical protein A2605_02220 [Candidatus Zambryskibacteria bacterium RIFOXYD1_FULL_39_35]OHB14964.1 MAG: hypothetical protein A2431_02850 [Candidatus Zambryskibacteria bacterium RIFOXYC1_FULL_39_10]